MSQKSKQQIALDQEIARSQQAMMMLAQAADRAGADALAAAVRRAAIIAVANLGQVRRG
jgi:hypothetical protein